MNRPKRFLVFSFFAVVSAVQAQNQSTMDQVRQEIEQLQNELREKEIQEKSLLEQREDIDHEIGLQRKLILELENERNKNEQRIQDAQINLENTNASVERLKKLIAQRFVSLYKQGQMKDWEILLSLKSFNQALVWLKYHQRIVESDRRNLRLLNEKEEEITTQKLELESERDLQNRLIQEHEVETSKLEDKKSSRETMIASIRADMQNDREMLENKQRALAEIQGRINQEELRRRSVESRDGTAFASLKGQLSWPVNGRITSKYGQRQHPTLKVTVENLGIEIETSERSPVRVVSGGTINWIQWRRSMGYIVLVDHGGGYYTVYAYLDMVLVNIGDSVEEGEMIGYVGDRQSLNGPTLHFEVWNGDTHDNPELWLRKS
ncbi:peptidoglycan DD-metalloendopeptidase family protein [bacterium]|nr:peptidoglycan DD-metalloendopeptidase family protein [bacterium]